MTANFMGLDNFDAVESTDPLVLTGVFAAMGFRRVAAHRSKVVCRYAEGDINFLRNVDTSGETAELRNSGPNASAMTFRVHDAANVARACKP